MARFRSHGLKVLFGPLSARLFLAGFWMVRPGLPVSNAASVPTNINKVVVVIEENHSYADVIGAQSNVNLTPAPYINTLSRGGANFTNATEVVASPSQPNYLELFSGSTQGITDDAVHPRVSAANLASELLAVGRNFVG